MAASFHPLIGRQYRKINNLDFLRFFLASIVIYCHCYILYYGTEDTVEPLWVFSHGQMSIGTLAVNFFFILSGFLIYQSWENTDSPLSYFLKRVLRIYPGFVVASLLCVLVIGPFGTSDFFTPKGYWNEYYHRLDAWKVLRNILMLKEVEVPWSFNNLPVANVVNGSMWTIRYEFYCYLLVMLFGSLRLFRFRWFNLGVFGVAMLLYAIQEYFEVYYYNWQELGIWGKPDFMPRFVMYFFSGILFYQFRALIPRIRSLFFLSIFICVLSAWFFEGLLFTLPVFGAYAIFYLAFSLHFRLYKWARFGDFSYGIYLYAWPIQQLLILFFEPYMNVWNLFSSATLLSVFMGFLSWNAVEKPFLRLKTKWNLHPVVRWKFPRSRPELISHPASKTTHHETSAPLPEH
jgi:peptidoglycan/LPS O-acetylase OafA/YrhL